MDTLTFLAEIYKYSNHNIYLWTSADKRTRPFTTDQLSEMADAARQLTEARQNVYFGVGTTTKQLGAYERPKNEEITGLSAFWVDIDVAGDAHAAGNLPPDVMAAQELLPDEPAPSIIVHSGHGLHVYYLLREEWPLDTKEERRQAAAVLRRLQGVVRQSAQARGWHIDSVADLTRVLRLPGTWNFKQPDAPVICQVIAAAGLRYNVSDFDALPEVEAATVAGSARAGGFERRPSDGPAAYMLQNCRFLQHWQLNYKTLPEPVWMAACTNLIRGVGGEEIAVAAARDWLGEKYNEAATLKKIEHWFNGAHPTTCQFIQNELRFTGCSACNVQSPCCWSLETVPRSVAALRTIAVPNAENVFEPETLGALAVLENNNAAEYAKFKEKCRGRVNLNDLSKAIKEQRRQKSGLTVIEGGAATLKPGQKLGEVTTCQSVPDTPLDLAIPAGFTYGPNGVKERRENESGNPIIHDASWNPVIISGHIENMDALGSEKLELSFKNRGKWKRTICKRSDVFVSRNLANLSDYGLGVSSETARYLVKYLQALEAANTERIPRKKAVSKLGWRDQESTFVLPGIESGYEIDLGGGMESKITGFKQSGDFGEWLAKMKEVRTRPKARLIMAAAFAAPLLKIVSQRSFAIHNWNDTRGGKTAAQHAALSIWGKPGDIARTFDDTRTSLERTAALYTDLPLGINEYELLSNKKKEGIDSMIYQICEGQGRGRGTINGLQETATWRTVAITNGESQIIQDNTKGGVFTRLIEVKGGPLADDDMFASSLYPFTARNHGHVGKMFIEKLLQGGYDEIRETYNRTREALRVKYTEKIPSHLDIMACIATAEYYASMWIFGLAEAQAGAESMRMVEEVIVDLSTVAESDESVRAWEWLPDWIVMNSKRFGELFSSSYETVGYSDEQYVYVIHTKMKEALTAAGFNASKVLSAWADQGKIPFTKKKDGRRRLNIRSNKAFIDNGVRPAVVRIDKAAVSGDIADNSQNLSPPVAPLM